MQLQHFLPSYSSLGKQDSVDVGQYATLRDVTCVQAIKMQTIKHEKAKVPTSTFDHFVEFLVISTSQVDMATVDACLPVVPCGIAA